MHILLIEDDLEAALVEGYAIQIALLHRNRRRRQVRRTAGQVCGPSKLGVKDLIEFFRSAAWIRFQSSNVFIKFCIIGAFGVLVNLGIFTALLAAGVDKFVASPIAIQTSIVTNFLGNNYWTFR